MPTSRRLLLAAAFACATIAGAGVPPVRLAAQAAPRPGVIGAPRPVPPRQPAVGPGGASTLPVPAAVDTSAVLAVFGFAYDSIAQAPLVNATIQLVSETDRGRSFTATTDSTGRYRIPGVRSGRYLAGLYHEVLDVLGAEAPTLRLLIRPDTAARLDFGTPSARTARAAICGPTAYGDTTGALIGIVRDAESGAGLNEAKVVVTWNEIQADETGIRNAHRRYPAKVRPGGVYTICGLPADGGRVEANAEATGRAGGIIDVAVMPRGVVRRDFLLGDSTTAVLVQVPDTMAAVEKRPAYPTTVSRGSARLTGMVRGRDGRVLPGARLQVWGSGVTGRTTDNGAFALSGLPSGTYNLEVRAIGYEPRRVAVDLSSRRANAVDVVLEKQVATLQGITVTGKSSKAAADYNGFLERKKSSFGRFYTEEDIVNRGAFVMSDVMRTTPGMSVTPNGQFGNVVRGRGGCVPEVYVDGMRVAQGADELDNIVKPQDVGGVEVYSGSAGLPPQFMSGNSGCGAVVVWTKRGGPATPRR